MPAGVLSHTSVPAAVTAATYELRPSTCSTVRKCAPLRSASRFQSSTAANRIAPTPIVICPSSRRTSLRGNR